MDKLSRKEYNKLYRIKNNDKLKEKAKIYRTAHSDVIKERRRIYRETNREKIKESQSRYNMTHKAQRNAYRKMHRMYYIHYYQTHKDKMLQQAKDSRNRHRDQIKDRRLRITVGITFEKKKAMWLQQQSCCALCRSPLPDINKSTVDHDHVSGKIRGILCHNCNLGLGHFKDDPIRLQAAIDYLNKHK